MLLWFLQARCADEIFSYLQGSAATQLDFNRRIFDQVHEEKLAIHVRKVDHVYNGLMRREE